MQNTVMRIVLIAACLVLVAGAVLTGYMLLNLDTRDIIDVEIDKSGTAVVEISSKPLNPGDSEEYVLAIVSQLPGDCILTMDFEEVKKGTLKNYLCATIEVDGAVVYDGKLAALIDGEEGLSVPCRISKREEFEIKVKYYMPLEVGNEAQNASANYLLHLTVSNE